MTQSVQILGSYWTLGVGADPLGDHRCHHDLRLRVETAAIYCLAFLNYQLQRD